MAKIAKIKGFFFLQIVGQKEHKNKLTFSVEPCTYYIKASNLSPSTGPRLVCTSLADDIDITIIEINVSSR